MAVLGGMLILIIGFRHHVGGDWENYGFVHDAVAKFSFDKLLSTFIQSQGDIGYNLLNWLSAQLGWGIYGVNITCATVFTWGLIKFCRFQPRPLLALTVAVPYLITIVAMGYTRQGVAIGLIMAGLIYLSLDKIWPFIILTMLAALFHKTAIVMVPLVMLTRTENKILTALWGGAFVAMLVTLLQENISFLVEVYVEQEYYQSEGAAIRLAMNVIPATIFLLYRKHLCYTLSEMKLWTWLALACLMLSILLMAAPGMSTPIDRIALYLIPIQLFVFSRLPTIGREIEDKNKIISLTVVYYGTVLFIWLNYAQTAFAWLPYQFYPWIIL